MVVTVSVPAQSTSSDTSVVYVEKSQVMDGTPSDDADISIEEPVSGCSDQMFSFNIGDSGGDFRSGNLSVQVQELVTEGLSNIISGFVLEEFVVQVVLGSENFSLIKMEGVVGQDHLGHEEHLMGMDFISVEVVTYKTGV